MRETSGSTPSNRDDGKADFAYFEDTSQWYDDAPVKHLVLDGSRGVTIEKVEPLVYRVSYQGKSVVFALNDLSQVKPPAGALRPDEKFIGPIFDESAIRFFLDLQSKAQGLPLRARRDRKGRRSSSSRRRRPTAS